MAVRGKEGRVRFLVLLAFCLLGLVSCDYREVEREIGYKGRARVHPWLAAERFIDAMGYPMRSEISWTAPDTESCWIVPAAILSNESYTRRMESWIRQGGHLVLLVEHTEPEVNDWNSFPSTPEFPKALHDFLERARMELTRDTSKATSVRFAGRKFKVDSESSFSIAAKGGRKRAFASAASGRGRITVVTDARIFRNRWIDGREHAALLDALLGWNPGGAVGIMRGASVSLWALLGKYLWPPLVALAVWILLWLWRGFSRFGPVESAAVPQELRGYSHHLEALGDFQWRLDRAASMLAPLREQIVELGQRTAIAAGRRDDDFFSFLADRAGIPRDRVFRALAEVAPSDSTVLTQTTSDLQQLLTVLHQPASS
ncbi:MAG: hypothetical protein H7A48_11510 [Akkermansiaceae bacterium]|nr:hypothetical protein [Akkermansiaceae bacterium]